MNRSLHREQILDAIWPHLRPTAAANNLRKNLYYLRTVFAERGIELAVVSLKDDMVVLAREAWIDIAAFRQQAAKARSSQSDPKLYEQALSTYRGDLLPEELYEDRTRPHREDLRALRDDLLSELAQLHVASGKVRLAEERLRELLQADPLREEAHRSLMRLYAEAGSREKALR